MRLLNRLDSQINLKEEKLRAFLLKKEETLSKENPIIRLTKDKINLVKTEIKVRTKSKIKARKDSNIENKNMSNQFKLINL